MTHTKAAKRRGTFLRRLFLGIPSEGFAAEPPDIGKPIGEQIGVYWAWVKDDCPLFGTPSKKLRMLQHACLSDTKTDLGFLAQHDSDWIRLAVASNPATPYWAIWGNQSSWLGLVGDSSAWVAASALMRHPYPPPSVVQQLKTDAAGYGIVRQETTLTEQPETTLTEPQPDHPINRSIGSAVS